MAAAPTAPVVRRLACVVMAGGKGTRMRSSLPKVLHEVCGRPILGWVLAAAREAGAERLVVVTPPDAEAVRALLGADATAAVQERRLGTGDAVRTGVEALPADFDGDVLVVSGDTPLIRGDVLRELVGTHRAADAAATLLTVDVPYENAYGRVVRGPDGRVDRVVEVRDATPDELRIRETNAGFYVFDAGELRRTLPLLTADNDQGELYLADVLPHVRAAGRAIVGHRIEDEVVTMGVNTRLDLANAGRELRLRLLEGHMLAGVSIVDPATTHVDVETELAPDSTIHPFTVLRGRTRVAAGAEVGPHAVLHDAVVGPGATAGPFVYLRPGATLLAEAKAGTYVEVKNATLGEGAKVPHLSYVGDADIGAGTNIGAGNITANFDGRRKHRTSIGAGVRTGSDCVFVAPVSVGDGAMTGAGSIITKDVPEGALAIARSRQTNIEGYAERRRGDA